MGMNDGESWAFNDIFKLFCEMTVPHTSVRAVKKPNKQTNKNWVHKFDFILDFL